MERATLGLATGGCLASGRGRKTREVTTLDTDTRNRGVAPPALVPQVKALAVSRVAVGTALLVAPRPVLQVWLGRHTPDAFSALLARSVGGRDVALGLGTLFALRHDTSVRGWLEALMVSDAADAVALLAAARHFPRGRLVAAALPTVSALAFGRWLVSRLES